MAKVISKLGVGEALVSMLQDKGIPMPVQTHADCAAALPDGRDHTRGARRGARRAARWAASTTRAVNRESAYEMLAHRAEQATAPAPEAGRDAPAPGEAAEPAPSKLDEFLWGTKRRQGAVEAGSQVGPRRAVATAWAGSCCAA